jgi:CBS-domain-containing membrane protein
VPLVKVRPEANVLENPVLHPPGVIVRLRLLLGTRSVHTAHCGLVLIASYTELLLLYEVLVLHHDV